MESISSSQFRWLIYAVFLCGFLKLQNPPAYGADTTCDSSTLYQLNFLASTLSQQIQTLVFQTALSSTLAPEPSVKDLFSFSNLKSQCQQHLLKVLLRISWTYFQKYLAPQPLEFGTGFSKSAVQVSPDTPKPNIDVVNKSVVDEDIVERQIHQQRLNTFKKHLKQIETDSDEKKKLIILVVDIDNTLIYHPDYTGITPLFIEFQQQVFTLFDQWLQTPEGSQSLLLIYNTARPKPRAELEHLRREGLPSPHFVLFDNGTDFISGQALPQYLQQLLDQRHPVSEVMSRLRKTANSNYESARQQMIDENGESIEAEFISSLHEYSDELQGTQDDAKLYESPSSLQVINGSAFYDLHRIFLQLTPITNNNKRFLYQEIDTDRELFLYDCSVNKGSALALLISHLLPLDTIQKKPVMFTSGDDIYDLFTLQFNLQSLAFQPPVQRSRQALIDSLSALDITETQWNQISSLWQAGILPTTTTPSLEHILRHHELIESKTLLRARFKGLAAILEQVVHSLTALEQ